MDGVDNPVAATRAVRGRPSTKVIVWGCVLLVVFGALGYFLYIISQPAEGIITTSTPAAATPTQAAPRTVRGKTVTFKYPATIQAVQPDTLAVGDVEKLLLIRSQLSAWSLAVQVKKLPSGVLADDGSYNFRKQNP